MARIPFAVQYSVARSRPLSVQRVLNLFAEESPPQEKTPVSLYATPGLVALGPAIDPATVRGLHVMAGVLYAVAGATLYKVDAGAAATSMGTVAGDGPVIMANNGRQILITNTNNQGYIASGASVAQIANPNFPGAGSVCFIDGYFIVNAPGSKKFFISVLNDGTSWNALDFGSAEADPDFIIRVFADHRELWLFGTSSIEIFYNSGASPFPFERVSGAFITRGCLAPLAVAALDNSIFWLADDGIVYRANGYTPVRVSTHAIERLIATMPNRTEARSFSYTQEGHGFYVLTFPNNGTVVYDAATGLWHERQTQGRKDWAVIDYARAYDRHVAGAFTSGKLFAIDPDTPTEDGMQIRRQAVTPSIWAESDRATMSKFQVDFETGVGLTTGQGSDPQAMLDFSDDGGKTWSNEKWASIGQIGKYKNRAKWDQLGQFRQRNMRVTVSDPVVVAIHGAYAEITQEAG